MAEHNVTVAYFGEQVDAGRMEVGQLAPSLLAFAEALQSAQHVLAPEARPLRIEVKATRQGSFEVDLTLVHTILERAATLLSGDPASAAANLLEILGAFYGAIELVKRIHRRVITRRERLEDGQIRITLDDGRSITTSPESLQVYDRITIRRLLRDFVRPIREIGMDRVEVRDGKHLLTVDQTDVDAFDEHVDGDVINESTSELALQISSISFKPGNKWRLSNGDQTFSVTIDDQGFLDRVAQDQERFAANDLLLVRMRTVQYQTEDGRLRTQHTATSVRHLPVAQSEQGELFDG